MGYLTPNSLRTRRPLAAGLIGGALAIGSVTAPASAQISGSASGTAVAQSTPAAGGLSASASYALESTVAQPATGAPSVSSSFRLESSIAWTDASLGTDAPILLGVAPANGDKAGGEPVTLVGANFAAPGAGTTAVALAGLPAGAVQVLGGTTIAAVTPSGTDAFGNPLAAIPVAVTNALGTGLLDGGYRYTPAILEASPTAVGGSLDVDVLQPPGALYLLWTGFAAPGAYLPVGTWDGSLAVMAGLTILAGPSLNPTGATTFSLPIPDDRSLAGIAVDLQAISITDLFASVGSFTNLLKVVLAP